jgi:hypothetical protein
MAPSDQTDLSLAKLCSKLEVVDLKIDEIKEKQEEMNQTIGKVKEALYGPDEGLYARLRDLENWKRNMSKIIYVLVTSWFGLLGYASKAFLETMSP